MSALSWKLVPVRDLLEALLRRLNTAETLRAYEEDREVPDATTLTVLNSKYRGRFKLKWLLGETAKP